jgi:hypothetical protein
MRAFEGRILNILQKFHDSTMPLRNREPGRTTIAFADEYDVQDLLQTHLLGLTPQVDLEDWKPSYAGTEERRDFLLKEVRATVLAKFVRDAEHVTELAEELIVDFDRYRGRADVDKVYCLVYDPQLLIGNPAALAEELSTAWRISGEPLEICVVIAPLDRSTATSTPQLKPPSSEAR